MEDLIIEVVNYMGLSFPIKPPLILNDTNQLYLKVCAYVNQDGKCLCGEELQDGELHHALISKKDVMGMDGDFIQHSLNVILLHSHCHKNINRKQSFEFLCHIFGEEKIRDWYEDSCKNFKSTFRQIEE